jgi:hypothetical protein
VIPLFVLASEVFPNIQKECLGAAAEAGTLTWKEGLVLEGNGLGKGILGNAYLLLSLSRAVFKLS